MASPSGPETDSSPGSAARRAGDDAPPAAGAADRGTEPTRKGVFGPDPDLLYDYMALLDQVLVLPEISAVLEDQNLTRAWMRNACVAAAGRVLQQAAPEYEAYRKALELRQEKTRDSADRILRAAAMAFAASGAIAVVAGVAGQLASWSAGFVVWWSGLGCLIIGGLAMAFVSARREGRFAEPDSAMEDSAAMNVRFARERLLRVVGEDHLLAFIRTLLNEARDDRLDPEFRVTASPGLSEVYRSDYHVVTSVGAEMEELTHRLSGGSVGIAGSRGSGKSTLIRRYCEPRADQPGGDLCCMVSAPVDYAARDFVLHLFATFCRAVAGYVDERPRSYVTSTRSPYELLRVSFSAVVATVRRYYWAGLGAALLVMQHFPVIRLKAGGHAVIPGPVVDYVALAVLALGAWYAFGPARWGFLIKAPSASITSAKGLSAEAGRNLARVRYLQTRTSGWSGSMTLPGGPSGQRSGGSSWAEQPLSYPEIVEQFRGFAGRAAEYVAGQGHRVFLGVDELDKIGTAEQAERFLNEIKGIFGVPHVYFLVSVSDEALTSFERRGLPLRDVFDSSFDEIIRVEPFRYEDSRRLLYRRVVGLTEPYIALCHCLSGGLARDLIRSARLVVRIGQSLPDGQPVRLAEVCTRLVREESRRKARAVAKILAARGRAGPTQDLLAALHAMINDVSGAEPSIGLITLVGEAERGMSAEAAALRLDLAGYLYFCLTLVEVFDERLDERRIRWATSDTDHPGHLDRLARARAMFADDTRFAWRLIDEVRTAWALPTCDPPAPPPAE
ncbi:hypothetical protein ACRYCC_27745 [Actinomadura scrupuli]|uniref:hypothetical protein n=1 Tax=Actinomadura scrupuli TaxID=559629 RepID=UPI003D99E45C